MTPRIPLPDDLGAAFTVAHALERGLGSKRLWGSDLERPFWGVRVAAGSLVDVPSYARAYSRWMPQHAFFSHSTAAQLWAIPLPLRLQAKLPLHVSVPHPRRAPESVGIVGHRLQIHPADVRSSLGLPMSSIERTVLDLAFLLSDEELLAVLDNVLWRRRNPESRASQTSILACLERFAGRRGTSRVEALLPLATDRSDSLPESFIRLRFIRAGFPDPVPNQNVYDEQGHFIAMPDLTFPHHRMAFDYEGDHHRTDAHQWRKDLRRVPLLEDAGWHHTRISGDDLTDSRALLSRTARRLADPGWARELRRSLRNAAYEGRIAAPQRYGVGRPEG